MAYDLTIYIAFYAAIVSTALLLWNIYKYYLNNISRIKVTVTIGLLEYTFNVSEPQLILNAANIGKKPVTLSSAGINMGKDLNLFFRENTNLPRRLEEGESHIISDDIEKLKRSLENHDPHYAFFRDQTGKEYVFNFNESIKKILKS